MKTPRLWAGLALALAFCGKAMALLPAGISGGWYNPAQSGHGLSIEILDEQRAIALWYVYDPQGNPVHLYIDGTIEGRSIKGPAYYSSGMRFGSFNPAEHQLSPWGRVEIEFFDCDHARLTYDGLPPAGASYGTGSIELTRLLALAGHSCRLGAVNALARGAYSGSVTVRPSSAGAIELVAAVDPDGVLWAAPLVPTTVDRAIAGAVAPLVIGTGVPQDGTRSRMTLDARANLAFSATTSWSTRIEDFARSGAINHHADTARVAELLLVQDTAAFDRNAVTRPLDLRDVSAHAYRIATGFVSGANNAPQPLNERLTVSEAGALCVSRRAPGAATGGECYYQGQITATYPGWTFFAFRLARAGERQATPILGRGWVLFQADGSRRVVLVGESERGGFAVVADQEGTR